MTTIGRSVGGIDLEGYWLQILVMITAYEILCGCLPMEWDLPQKIDGAHQDHLLGVLLVGLIQCVLLLFEAIHWE